MKEASLICGLARLRRGVGLVVNIQGGKVLDQVWQLGKRKKRSLYGYDC